ncbi:MAG: nitroreductase family protein [Candidatus Lokiarchaeota archaeon]|nr:nitroreductase family protein [Candidatus Lokiarchaeota archaeon]
MTKDSIIDVINRRTSWRSYDTDYSVPHEILDELKEYIASFETVGPFGNKARFELLRIPDGERNRLNSEYGTYGFIKGAEYFLAGAISKKKWALEDFGYIFEHIILKATELNLGTCWMAGTFKRSTIARDINLQQDEIIPAITPIGIPAESRRVVGKLIRFVIRAKKRKPWEELFFNEPFLPLKKEMIDESSQTALEMVRLAPSAKNKQPWRIVLDSKGNAHFYIQTESRDSHIHFYQRLDIGIAMCHFELTKRYFKKDGNWKALVPEVDFKSQPYHYVATWIEKND